MENQKPENIERAKLHFIQGNANKEEHVDVLNWLNKHPGNRKRLFAEKDLWDAALINSKEIDEIETEQWEIFKKSISKHQLKNIRFKEMIKIAAIVIFALGVGWMSHYFYQNSVSNRGVEIKTVEAIKGQIKEIFLADGTHVWLNADSKLSFPSNFTKDKREIELEGEAFFEVTSNEENPFLVKTKNHTVKVTGTQFNICEYPESKIIETTLIEGKVKIMSGNFIQDLKPGQQSTFYTETAEVKINEPDFEIYTAWKEGRYEFNNEPIEKIFQIVERWWDVKIVYPEAKLKNECISGVLRRHKSVGQHFEVIQQLIPIDYEISADVIKVTLK